MRLGNFCGRHGTTTQSSLVWFIPLIMAHSRSWWNYFLSSSPTAINDATPTIWIEQSVASKFLGGFPGWGFLLIKYPFCGTFDISTPLNLGCVVGYADIWGAMMHNNLNRDRVHTWTYRSIEIIMRGMRWSIYNDGLPSFSWACHSSPSLNLWWSHMFHKIGDGEAN